MNENQLSTETVDTDASSARVDPNLTLALAQASLAAYYDFVNEPFVSPPNYRCVGRFTGWDDWIGSWGSEERFGLIFKYVGPQMIANRFIVAFRGTDSLLDAYDDAFWEFADFQPFCNQVTPAPEVCAGFYDIYATKGDSMTQTMQQQIFGMLPDNPSEVLITGHSLGAALSQLFTLDMKLSSPRVGIENVNFASPRVGGANWQAACDSAGATRKIMRVINYWDVVPENPPELLGYLSVGKEFQTAFSRCGWIPNLLSDHSLLNLQTVLRSCVYLNPQVWVGSFDDAVDSYYTMCSTAVPGTDAARKEFIGKLKESAEIRNNAAPRQKN
jgi:triacylglycerol lipase